MSKMASKRISAPCIVQPGAGRSPVILGLFMLLLLALGWQAFEYGRIQAGFDKAECARERDKLMGRISQQEQLIGELRLEAAKHKRAAQVEGDAARQVQDDLVALQVDRAELKKEVGFLRGLIAENSGPMYIRDFRLESGSTERQFHYYLTVAQVLENVGTTRATMKLVLSGKLEGENKQLKMSEVDGEKRDSTALKFRHFQDVAGVMLLPEGFEPGTLTVEISPKSKKLKKLTKVFEWSLTSQEESSHGT